MHPDDWEPLEPAVPDEPYGALVDDDDEDDAEEWGDDDAA